MSIYLSVLFLLEIHLTLSIEGKEKRKLDLELSKPIKWQEIPEEGHAEPLGPGCLRGNEMHDYRR